MNIVRHEQGGVLTQVVEAGGLIFTSGILPKDSSADISSQSTQVLAEVDRLLALAGTSKSKIVSTSIWVTDIRLRDAFNEVWVSWVDPANVPARACVESKLADHNALVEVSVVAVK